MKQTSLDELLTETQIHALDFTISELLNEGIEPLDTKFINVLKELFGIWKEHLESKGINSDYLAYAVAYAVSQQK